MPCSCRVIGSYRVNKRIRVRESLGYWIKIHRACNRTITSLLAAAYDFGLQWPAGLFTASASGHQGEKRHQVTIRQGLINALGMMTVVAPIDQYLHFRLQSAGNRLV